MLAALFGAARYHGALAHAHEFAFAQCIGVHAVELDAREQVGLGTCDQGKADRLK